MELFQKRVIPAIKSSTYELNRFTQQFAWLVLMDGHFA